MKLLRIARLIHEEQKYLPYKLPIFVHFCSFLFIFVHFCSFLFIFVHFCSFLFIFVHFCSFLFIFVHYSSLGVLHPIYPPEVSPPLLVEKRYNLLACSSMDKYTISRDHILIQHIVNHVMRSDRLTEIANQKQEPKCLKRNSHFQISRSLQE